MTEFDRCPSCDKPVQSRVALLDHLEFGHQIEDPVGYMLDLQHVPRRRYDRRPLFAWAGVVAVILAAVVGGIAALSGAGPDDEPDLAAASSGAVVDDPTSTPTTDAPPTTAAPDVEASASTTVPTTAAPPPTTPPAATAPSPTAAEPVPAASFRKPFLGDASVVSCSTVGAEDVYVVGFTLSGARDIVLGGESFLGDSGDGAHEILHATPSGTTGWLDRIVVTDGDGDEHVVPITPPLHLGGCSA